MYSAKKPQPAPVGNSPYQLSPYKKCVSSSDLVADAMNSRSPISNDLPKSVHQSRFLEAKPSIKLVPRLNPPKIKNLDLGVKPLARKPPPVYNPVISDSSSELKPKTCQQTTSSPAPVSVEKVNPPKLPSKSIKHKKSTTSLKKQNGFSVNAKGAFDRFIKSAKRNLTLDSTKSNEHQSNKTKSKPMTNKLMISYPKRIHSPDFDFIKSPGSEIEEIKPRIGLRRSSSTAGNLNSRLKPILNRQNSTIKRSQTCARRVLNLNQFSKSNKSKLKIIEPHKLVPIPENEIVPKPPSYPSETEKSQDETTLCGTDNKSYETIVGETNDQQFSSQASQPVEEIGLAMLPEDNGEADLTSRRASFQDRDETPNRRNSKYKDTAIDHSEALHQVSPPWKAIPLNDTQLRDTSSPDPVSVPISTRPRSRFSILESSLQSFTPSTQDSNNFYKTTIIEKTTFTPHYRKRLSLRKHLNQSSTLTSDKNQQKFNEEVPLIDEPSDSPPSCFSRLSVYSDDSQFQEETIEEDITLALMGCGSSYTPYNLKKFYSNMSSTTNTTNPSCASETDIDEKKSDVSGLEDKGKMNKLDLDINHYTKDKEEIKMKKDMKIKKKSLHRFSNLLGLDKSDFDYCSDWCFDLMRSLSKVKV
ncbi:hypothetical protein DFH28DRAFT_1049198 [Melampsora americana]|nr:hypothetical protein DFH28DRAFT_1049198 [Melampsora americana]